MSLCLAEVLHRSSTRLRVRIASKKGNRPFFAELKRGFADYPGLESVETNPVTGSILFLGEKIDPEGLLQYAADHNLFIVKADKGANPSGDPPRPLPNRAVKPVAFIERSIRRLSGGRLDLSGTVFFSLLGTGAYQLVKGNLGAPPWHTAFWYAFALYTQQIGDNPPEHDAIEPG